MLLAERFELPIITFVDCWGFSGAEAEERCQSEAIATNLATMSELNTNYCCCERRGVQVEH